MNSNTNATATKIGLGALGLAAMTVTSSAHALVGAVTGAFDETVMLGVGGVVMLAAGVLLLIRSGRKAAGG